MEYFRLKYSSCSSQITKNFDLAFVSEIELLPSINEKGDYYFSEEQIFYNWYQWNFGNIRLNNIPIGNTNAFAY